MTLPPQSVVAQYFAAMQRGPDGFAALTALFADDAIYVEPFSGAGPHHGREAIRVHLAATSGMTPPDIKLYVEQLDMEPGRVVAHWRCESPAFARPSRGRDEFLVRDGRIARLETTLLEGPR